MCSFRHSGLVYSTRVTLGGKLTSVRSISTKTAVDMTEEKSKMKAAAGASFSSSFASGSVKGSYENQSENKNESMQGSSSDTMAWEATGGDTLLASK
jgi:hypothetical protein